MLPFLQSSYFTALLESLAAGTIIANSSGTVYAGNEQAASLFCMARENLVGLDVVADLAGGMEPAGELAVVVENARKRIPRLIPLYLRYRRPEGGLLHLSLTVSLLVEYDKLFGILLQFQDITEMVALHEREKAILEEQAALQRERIESLHNFSMAVAHQIRNPLMCIGGFAKRLIRKKRAEDAERPALEAIVDSAERLEGIVAAVSDYGRREQGEYDFLDIRDFVRDAAASIRVDGQAARSVKWIFRLEPIRLRFAPALLGRALLEVLRNACEALPETGGTITVTGAAEPGRYRLDIVDGGHGAAPDILPYVFDPFFTTKAVGVGMGLTKAKQCAADLGGDIRLEDAPGGARAIIRIPLHAK